MAELTVNGKLIPFPKLSPNCAPRAANRQPTLIVLHSTGGAYRGAVAWLMNPDSGVSAHFVISRRAEMVQLVSLADVAWHAGRSSYQGQAVGNSVNQFAIGIELEHLDSKQDWPAAQMEACADLCAVLCQRLDIDPKHIVGHRDVAPGRKVDPVDFPWALFRRRVAAQLATLTRNTSPA
jgi:N-acetylmuramoyl-L-alanine amidase